MDFARKILYKYGWKDGDGLGKNNDGIAKPLKATLKFDNAGFGANQAAADFNNHWWERVFNDAANNMDIKRNGEQIKVELKDNNGGVEISTKGYSMKKLKRAKQRRKVEKGYDNFLQAATLTNKGDEIDNPDKIDTDDFEVTNIKVLTDEELFKACGGRTAHKGARHGLKLSGKLSRIEQQEAELLAKMMEKNKNVLANGFNMTETQDKESTECIENKHTYNTKLVTKRNKNKIKEKPSDECQKNKPQCEVFNERQSETTKSNKKKRKHKAKTIEESPVHSQIQTAQNKKKKIDDVCTSSKTSENEDVIVDCKTGVTELRKKHKKKKKKVVE